MSGQDRRAAAHATRAAMRLAQPFYWAGLRLDQHFKAAHAQPLHRPTVSVGNLTAGGTGKTPMTAELVQRLQQLGHRPAILLRGDPPPPEVPKKKDPNAPPSDADEAEMLQAALGDAVPVEPNPSRIAAAAAVLQRAPHTTCFILDDGFQHRQVKRDLDLVLIDATRPFGFGHLLPRGLLREPRSALRRADALILTRADQVTPQQRAQLVATLTQHHGQPPLAHATQAWTTLRLGNDTTPVESLQTLRVHGVCAIGNPDNFQQQLQQHVATLTGFSAFNDHHAYQPAEIADITQQARDHHADAIVLTEKDWPKWQRAAADIDTDLPVFRPVLALQFPQGHDALNALLREHFPNPT